MIHQTAVKAFIIKNNDLLILKRSSKDVQSQSIWELPGGRLRSGEDTKTGLIREVKEETNLGVVVLEKLSEQNFTRIDNIRIGCSYIFVSQQVMK